MENKFGLSKKTNVTMAAIAGIGLVKEFNIAIAAISLVTLVSITYQFLLDKRK